MAHRSSHERHESNPENIDNCPKKRIIVCCDGTWQDADGTDTTPSNVARLVRSIPPVGVDYSSGKPKPISQVVYYQNGIGTGSAGWYQKHVGSKISGATGEGLIFNVREAYAFVCSNYHRGDEIIIVGFSRGAFTARTISSLIYQLGLLTPKGLNYLVELVDDWEFQLDGDRVSPYPSMPWANRPKFDHNDYKEELAKRKLTRPNIPIKCVAVWDTVGALGVPSTALHIFFHRLFHKLPRFIVNLFPKSKPRPFAFVDTSVNPNIEYAFHALALDEKRESFTPTVWYRPEDQDLPKVLKQTWFSGVHSDVGGSYANDDNANITLAWMIGQFETHQLITFNKPYILRLIHSTIQHHIDAALGPRRPSSPGQNINKQDRATTWGELQQWGTGKIHESFEGVFRLGGYLVRTPMQYKKTTRDEGVQDEYLKNTFETMHASVRVRCKLDAKDWTGIKLYKHAPPMRGWDWHALEDADPMTAVQESQPGEVGRVKGVEWIKHETHNGKTVEACRMPEDTMAAFEREVLRAWTAADDWEEDAKLRNDADQRESVLEVDRRDVRQSPAINEQYQKFWKHNRKMDAQKNGAMDSVSEVDSDDEGEHSHQYFVEEPQILPTDVAPGSLNKLHIATNVTPNPEVGHTPREQTSIAAY